MTQPSHRLYVPSEDVQVGDQILGLGRVHQITPYEGLVPELQGGRVAHCEGGGQALQPGELVAIVPRREIHASGRQPWVPPGDWRALLESCCGHAEMQPWMHRPWSYEGGLGATNSKACVWADVTGPAAADAEPVPEHSARDLREWREARATLGSGYVPRDRLYAWAMAAACHVCGDTWDERCPEGHGSREHAGLIAGGVFDRRLVAEYVVAPATIAGDDQVRLDVMGTEEAPQIVARGEGWWASVMGVRADDQSRADMSGRELQPGELVAIVPRGER